MPCVSCASAPATRSTRKSPPVSLTEAPEILALEESASAWDEVLASEPLPPLVLEAEALDRALAAMGNFADLISPYLAGHSAGVADLAPRRRAALPASMRRA